MNDRITIKVKRVRPMDDVPLPDYETSGSAGMDLRAVIENKTILNPGEIKLIPTGLAVSIPAGYEAQIRPRSGLSLKYGVGMANSPGTIDSDYRGEIGLILVNWGRAPYAINRGDRIAQMIVNKVYKARIVEVDSLDATGRGDGGFGHSGLK